MYIYLSSLCAFEEEKCIELLYFMDLVAIFLASSLLVKFTGVLLFSVTFLGEKMDRRIKLRI